MSGYEHLARDYGKISGELGRPFQRGGNMHGGRRLGAGRNSAQQHRLQQWCDQRQS